MQRYSYSELPPRHIRLLEIERQPDNQLQGRLSICSLSKLPRYEALSYVWGPEDPKFPIGRQEPIFDVPQNLYTALHSIMSMIDTDEPRTLWIDQMCINQGDLDERREQVKLMRDIYESAHDVLVWLGVPLPGILNVAAYLEQIPKIIKKVELNVARIGPNFLPSVSAGLPLNDDPVWAVIVDILHKDWYNRVWTLQEAVLAKRLVVYYGSNILDWDFVVKLYTVYGSAPYMPLRGLFDEDETNYQSISWIQTYRKRRERNMDIDFTHLLWTGGFKKSRDTIDRIYGMLGMVEKSIREKIEPDFKAQERQAFLKAFRAAIECDPQLHILSLAFDRGNTMEFPGPPLPTWCPNLMKWNECVQLNSYCVGIRSPTDKFPTVPLTDSDSLKIQGLEVDKISSIASSQYPNFKLRDMNEREIHLFKFHDETLKMAQLVYKTPVPEEYCRTLIADVPRAHDGRTWSTEEMMAGYQSLFTKGRLQAHRNANESSLASKYSSSAIKACAGRRFITTKNNRVGLAPANCQIGDMICVFLGAVVPHILRPNDTLAQDTTFSFVGDCYLHGIMKSEALDMLDEGKLERREFIVT